MEQTNKIYLIAGNTTLRLQKPPGSIKSKREAKPKRVELSKSWQQSKQFIECQMRTKLIASWSLELARLRCCKRSNRFNGFALLVCIFGFILVVCCANHIHQLDSNVINDGSISSNMAIQKYGHPRSKPSTTTTTTADNFEDKLLLDKERIQVRHNYTFRVNGRQLALEPPKATAAALSTASKRESQKISMKINRVGDSPVDYESSFEPSNDSADSSQSGFNPVQPASHSSALMSSSTSPSYSLPSSTTNSHYDRNNRRASAKDQDKDRAKDNDNDSDSDQETSSGKGLGKGLRNLDQELFSLSPVKQDNNESNKQNRIISDWPKSIGREHSSGSAPVQSGRQSWSQDNNDTYNTGKLARQLSNLQAGPKYSALLSNQANANELASQSGEPSKQKSSNRWDSIGDSIEKPAFASAVVGQAKQPQQQHLTGRIKLTISSRLAQTIDRPTGGSRKDDGSFKSNGLSSAAPIGDRPAAIGKTGKRGSSSRKQTMRSSAHARQRYSISSSSVADKVAPIEPPPDEVAAISKQDNSIRTGGTMTKTASGNNELRFTSSSYSGANNLTKKELAPIATMSYEIPAISISEHQTNFSGATSSLPFTKIDDTDSSSGDGKIIGNNTSKRQMITTRDNMGKSSIVQRDLTRVVHPPHVPPGSEVEQQQQQPPTTTDSGRAASSSLSFRLANDAAMAVAAAGGSSGGMINAARPNNSTTNDQFQSADPFQRLGMLEPLSQLHLPNQQQLSFGQERVGGSIVRTGPIHMPHQLASSHSHHLSALVPAAMALLAQAHQEDQQSSMPLRLLRHHQRLPSSASVWPLHFNLEGASTIAAGPTILAKSSAGSGGTPATAATAPLVNETQLFNMDQMIATSNHLGVAHLGPHVGPSQRESGHLSASETSSYGSMADYADRVASDANLQSNFDSVNQISSATQPALGSSAASNMSGDEQRFSSYPGADYPNEPDQTNLVRSHQQQQQPLGSSSVDSQVTNSRSSISSMSDPFLRSDHKSQRDSPGVYSSSPSIRGSLDPFIDDLTVGGGLGAVGDYERELADLDEEFSRHTRRPTTMSGGPLMGESYVSLSPERYEARRFNRRPSSYDFGTGEYLSTAGSMSSIIPRAYPRGSSPWSTSSGSPYSSESSDLWSDTSPLDYGPLMSSSHAYAYRWRPRFQRITSAYPGSPYLTAAASEQQLQPGYSILPAFSTAATTTAAGSSSFQPTETISFTLSPLAAAAAAAASALAAAEKSRHQSHAWLTLPRITTTSANQAGQPSLGQSQPATSASNQHASSLPASLPAAAYLAAAHRPGPYALSPIPIYAFAPRPPGSPATMANAGPQAAAMGPTMIPYFHGATPTLLAYRTAAGMLPAGSLLTAASFGYPFRLPITAASTTLGRPPIPFQMSGSLGSRQQVASSSGRPFLTASDLQFAETNRYKSNSSNSNGGSDNNKSGFAKSSSTLSAMAKNLTKKVFGSASQLRPQHVAPPSTTTNSGYSDYSPSQPITGALSNLSQSSIIK